MSPDRPSLFADDIANGPAALERLLDGWHAPDLRGRDRFVFTGLGSSRYAAQLIATALRSRGSDAWVEHASTSTPARPTDEQVLVAISASGRTPEVVAAAEAHRGRNVVVAVTNGEDSPLAAVADIVIPLHAGEERSGIACRTFRATVAALALLTGIAELDGLRPDVDALRSRIDGEAAWLPPMVNALDGAPSIDVLADGSLLGLAEQAALMLREAPRLPAHAAETGDWLHTGVYLAFPGHRALLFPGSVADAEVTATIRRRGGSVASIPSASDAPRDAIPGALVDSVVAELLACELWRRVDANDKGPLGNATG